MTIADDLTADFQRELPHTRKLLAAVPEAELGWRPHEQSWTLAQLAGHIAESPAWLSSIFEDEMDFARMQDYAPFVPETKAELLETAERNAGTFAPALEGREDAFLRADWTMRMGDQVILQAPRAQVIRDILIHHLVHHRGQLTVYLRLLGVPVPATYGNSADDSGGM